MSIQRFVVSANTLLALGGCLVPERFTAKVDVRQDGSYSYRLCGTMVSVPGLIKRQAVGQVTADDESVLQADTASIAKVPSVKEIRYLGDLRYQIDVREDGQAGQRCGKFS